MANHHHHQSGETPSTATDRAVNISERMSPPDLERAGKLFVDAFKHFDPASIDPKQYQIEANNTFLKHPSDLRSDAGAVAKAAVTDQKTFDAAKVAQKLLAKGDLKGAEKLLTSIDTLVSADRVSDLEAAGTQMRDGKPVNGPNGQPVVDGEGGTDGQNAKEEAAKIAIQTRMLHEGRDQWGNELSPNQIKALQLDRAETTAEFYNNVRDGQLEVGYAGADDAYSAARQALQAHDTADNRANLVKALAGLMDARQQDKNNETGARKGDDGYLGQDKRTIDSAEKLNRKFFKHVNAKHADDGTRLVAEGTLPPVSVG